MNRKHYICRTMFLRILWPSLISSVALAIADVADALVIGNRMGESGLAAIGIRYLDQQELVPFPLPADTVLQHGQIALCLVFPMLGKELPPQLARLLIRRAAFLIGHGDAPFSFMIPQKDIVFL